MIHKNKPSTRFSCQFLLVLFILLFSNHINAQQTINGTLMHGGIQRSYILYVPQAYNPTIPAPLVFNFHGYTSSAEVQINYGDFRPMANLDGFLLVVPQGTVDSAGNTHFNVGWGTSTVDDVGFINALLDDLATQYTINQDRIYSAGMSNGGFMSYRLACELSGRIAAIASVTGSMTLGTVSTCSPSHPTPVLEIHGTADGTVNYDGSNFATAIPDVLTYWSDYNNTDVTPSVTSLPDTNTTDGSTVEHIIYANGDNNVKVEHFKVIGGGHTWPGNSFAPANQDINAAQEIWDFFSRYDINGEINALSNEAFELSNITIYPNPAVSELVISNKNFTTNLDYKIISLPGHLLNIGKITSNNQIVDISYLPGGLYFLMIENTIYKILKTN